MPLPLLAAIPAAVGGIGAGAGGLATAGAGTLAAGSAGITAAAGGAAGTFGSALGAGSGMAAMTNAGIGAGLGGTLGATTTATSAAAGLTPIISRAGQMGAPNPNITGVTGQYPIISRTGQMSGPGGGNINYSTGANARTNSTMNPIQNNPLQAIGSNPLGNMPPGPTNNAFTPIQNTPLQSQTIPNNPLPNNINTGLAPIQNTPLQAMGGNPLANMPPPPPGAGAMPQAAPELNYLQQLAQNPYYRSMAMGQLAKLTRKNDRAGSVPVTYATAQAEAERKRRNFMTGTAYQTQAKMIKDPTSQKNLLRMGGPRAVTQSRILADDAVKDRALNQLILGSTQLEMKEQQMADQYGIMADKTQLDLDLLADTQKRAQGARDEQALTASMSMAPYANSDGGGGNAIMQQMLMQQMLKQNP